MPLPTELCYGPEFSHLGAWVSHCKSGEFETSPPLSTPLLALLCCAVNWSSVRASPLTHRSLVLDLQHLELESQHTSFLCRVPNLGNSVSATETRLSWCDSKLCEESWKYPVLLIDKCRPAGLCSSAWSISWVAGYLLSMGHTSGQILEEIPRALSDQSSV